MAGHIVQLGGIDFVVDRISLAAKGKGQDRDLVIDDLAVVVDGASPVMAKVPVDVGEFAAVAAMAIADHEPTSLAQRVRCAIRRVGVATGDHATTPSAALVLAQVRAGLLEVGVLGDCLGVAVSLTGQVFVTPRDERLAAIDGFHSARIGQLVAEGLSFEIARDDIRQSLIAQRLLMNAPGGYWVFAHDPAAADHLGQFQMPVDELDSLLLCSDGFARLWELFGLAADPLELVALCREQGLAELSQRLRTLEQAVDSVRDWPRVSLTDDATALLLTRSGAS